MVLLAHELRNHCLLNIVITFDKVTMLFEHITFLLHIYLLHITLVEHEILHIHTKYIIRIFVAKILYPKNNNI